MFKRVLLSLPNSPLVTPQSDLLVKARDVQATTDIQVSEPEDWEENEAISECSDSSSSEEEEEETNHIACKNFSKLPTRPIVDICLTDIQNMLAFNIRSVPKRRAPPIKKGNSSKRMRKVVEIPKDESGKPILPIQIGSFQLISLGKVELRDGYYNERYIWPVGYCIKR